MSPLAWRLRVALLERDQAILHGSRRLFAAWTMRARDAAAVLIGETVKQPMPVLRDVVRAWSPREVRV